MSEATTVAIIVKAAPVVGRTHGETVCVAGLDYDGNWHRLYPIPFRDLDSEQKFGRWDVVRFTWREPRDDNRPESKNVDSQSLQLIGKVPQRERHAFARSAIVPSLDQVKDAGKSFALIRPERPKFIVKRHTKDELEEEGRKREALHAQSDLFSVPIAALEPAPYTFSYRFYFDGSERNYRCIDWETEATFFRWRAEYGEEDAIAKMQHRFGTEYPMKGVAFAMGTHRVPIFGTWLLSGILRVDEVAQGQLL
ncbi:hypothetical protein [Jannaschia sp. CCS1]|uniref:hypothetical protein n=1 Tax=Jannaschia sp. (strain CCS1) TaxID=290400 RepID=UPI000053B7FB|nr:hypothetical protein [Jannaschia sp. CCS1]ABD53504.1 hypothetical protein Jann_0587 [Jannaschia sp. CCS1]